LATVSTFKASSDYLNSHHTDSDLPYMSPIKVLVVEDEAIVAEDIASCLEKMGYSIVDIVATGEEAIAAATSLRPDLVLMDIMLQGDLDGVEATQQIRENLKLPVVYLTANADEHTLERAKITSPFGYILKPFKDKELRATIEIALSRHQSEMEVQKALIAAETLRREAEASSDMKTQFLSMATHEFRTPLSVIGVAAELLQNYSDRMPESQKQQSIQRIQAASQSMNDLLEDVLTLGQVESGNLNLALAPLEVVAFCQELVEMVQLGAGEQHKIQFVCADSTLRVHADEKLLWHTLNNLLINAVKYSPEGSTVWLTLTRQTEHLIFEVKDQGIGIPKIYRQHLFEPFQRAGNVGKIPGTGLGLAIAKRAIDLHNGQISVDSEVAHGSTFTVSIPLQFA
jgi:signal transduction histidine kinase